MSPPFPVREGRGGGGFTLTGEPATEPATNFCFLQLLQ